MQKIILTRGLPASGKSTYALKLVKDDPSFIRINKDTIREMIGKSFSKSMETLVKSFRNVMVNEALVKGYSVIIDDTNLSDKHINYFTQLTNQRNIELDVRDEFLYVPLETLLERNRNREKKVPEDVIINMYKQFINKNTETKEKINIKPSFVYDENKKKCILVDIDGTIALHWNRSPFEFNRVDEDVVNVPVMTFLANFNNKEIEVIFVSGREGTEECKVKTMKWLKENLPDNIKDGFKLYMRQAEDNRKDFIIKKEIYEQYIMSDYNVVFVLDDRNQTVEMWRSINIPCFQVGYGNF